MNTYHIIERSQKSVGGGNGKFGGPDKYVALVVVPEGVEFSPSEALHRERLRSRGVEVYYCGEGYSKNYGPRSALGKARAEAERKMEELQAQEIVAEQVAANA